MSDNSYYDSAGFYHEAFGCQHMPHDEQGHLIEAPQSAYPDECGHLVTVFHEDGRITEELLPTGKTDNDMWPGAKAVYGGILPDGIAPEDMASYGVPGAAQVVPDGQTTLE